MTTRIEKQVQRQLDKWHSEYIRKWKKAPTLNELSDMRNNIVKELNNKGR